MTVMATKSPIGTPLVINLQAIMSPAQWVSGIFEINFILGPCFDRALEDYRSPAQSQMTSNQKKLSESDKERLRLELEVNNLKD